MPVIGRHSVMLKPDSVRRVTPPTTTTTRTKREEIMSHIPTAGGGGGRGSVDSPSVTISTAFVGGGGTCSTEAMLGGMDALRTGFGSAGVGG